MRKQSHSHLPVDVNNIRVANGIRAFNSTGRLRMFKNVGFKEALETLSLLGGMLSAYVLLQMSVIASKAVDDHNNDHTAHIVAVSQIKDQLQQERESRIVAGNEVDLVQQDVAFTKEMLEERKKQEYQEMMAILREIRQEIAKDRNN